MLVSVNLYEFGSKDEFNMDNNNYLAYPTWDFKKQKSYRPTNEKCIMHNMLSTTFCNVCKESIWSQFLKFISLINSLDYKKNTLVLKTLKLGQFCEGGKILGEKLVIEWTLNNSPATQYNRKLIIPSPAKGKWTVIVKFTSPKIHQKSPNWASHHQTIQVK
ncbi:hypothetical protein DSO57_1003240 [Entomophthora muscae]|uniref:Uncharacterized protein n=1 Tax=Entomophthora muscae TaxID=34485 RepID=A0ACC2TWP0_9FUNG|nr:hypothetical protein DSO57_1003240 [Entomophthora muscae]